MDIVEKLQQNWKFWFTIIYFTVVIVLLVAVFNKHVRRPVPEVIQPAPTITVDLEPLNKRIAALEQDLTAQTMALKAAKSESDALIASNQRLERRLQSHTEAFKRLCEYVLVITVDKKIIPRQCLPEYKWAREEGN